MSIQTPLYKGETVFFSRVDPERDAGVESRWTHEPRYLRMVSLDVARPSSPAQIKKNHEEIQKQADERKNTFYFAVRTRQGAEAEEEARLIGFAHIAWVDWPNGTASVRLGIGSPDDWGKGYGSQALHLLLNYAFNELNLFHLTALVPEYNQAALRLFQRAGFREEVRRREAIHRDGRRWDLLNLGILRDERQAAQKE